MATKLSLGLSLLIVSAAFAAVLPGAAASHAPSASVSPGTVYEKGSTGQTTMATFTGSYNPDAGETKVSNSETWLFPDNGQTLSGAVVQREFKDAGTWVVTFSVLVSLANGDVVARSKDVPITVTNPAPTASHNVPSIVSGQPLDVRFDFTDNQGIQTATLFYRKQGQTTFTSQLMTKGSGAPAGAERWSYSIPASFLTEPVEYYATATDISKVPQTATFRPTATTYYVAGAGAGDNQPPTITLTFTGTQVVPYGNSFAFLIGMTDPSGIKSATFNYKKPAAASYTTVNVNLSTKAAAIPWSTSVGGLYNWYVTVTDNNDNVGSLNSAGSPGSVTLAVGPKLQLTVPTATQKLTPGANLVIQGNLTDDKAGVSATLAYNTGGGASWTSGSSGLTLGGEVGTAPVTRTVTLAIPMPGSEFARDILFFVNLTDSDGNALGSGLMRVTVSTDATKPTITAETPTGPVKAIPAISATWSDAGGSGVNAASGVISIDGTVVPPADRTATPTGISVNGTKAIVTALTDGTHTVVVTVSDNHGNTETKTWTFLLDKTPPTFSGETTGFVKTAEVAVGVTEAGSGVDAATVTATIDGAPATAEFHAADGEVHVAGTGLADGSHAVKLTVKDKAGNEAVKEWTFSLDSVAPTIASASFDAAVTTAKPTITVTFSDAGSGVKASTATLKINGVAQTVSATATGFTFTPTADLKSGANTVEITVEDNVGNKATMSKTMTVNLPAVAKKKGFFGLPGFEAVFAVAALGAAMLLLRRRA